MKVLEKGTKLMTSETFFSPDIHHWHKKVHLNLYTKIHQNNKTAKEENKRGTAFLCLTLLSLCTEMIEMVP